MNKNIQSRKWGLVINNPDKCGLDHFAICNILNLFYPTYYCMADEISTTGTFHTHVFLYSTSPIRFSTVKNRFPTAHIDKSVGSVKENRDYILKSGKWENSDKAKTNISGSFYEYGVLPTEMAEKHGKMGKLIDDIKSGVSNAEIIRQNPTFAFHTQQIDVARQTLLSEEYGNKMRDVDVHYIFGETGTGKTSGIYKKHDISDIYRVTNYGKGNGVRFDGYESQSVIVFEEFHSQIPIAEMLNYTDIYPLKLPARYSDKIACYKTVYITSNISLDKQYRDVQFKSPETWNAFRRRISDVFEYKQSGMIIERNDLL